PPFRLQVLRSFTGAYRRDGARGPSQPRARAQGPLLADRRTRTRLTLRGEDHFGARAALVAEVEPALQLVAHQCLNDREPGAARVVLDAAAVVGDRQDHLAVSLRELDPHGVPAVLERVLEQLAEDECERGSAGAGKRHRRELRMHVLA